jgi:hypothetical protein
MEWLLDGIQRIELRAVERTPQRASSCGLLFASLYFLPLVTTYD